MPAFGPSTLMGVVQEVGETVERSNDQITVIVGDRLSDRRLALQDPRVARRSDDDQRVRRRDSDVGEDIAATETGRRIGHHDHRRLVLLDREQRLHRVTSDSDKVKAGVGSNQLAETSGSQRVCHTKHERMSVRHWCYVGRDRSNVSEAANWLVWA